MPFLSLVDRVLDHKVLLNFLAFTDLPSVRLVNCNMEAVLVDGKIWLACAKTALPGFDFCSEHFELPLRCRFMALVLALMKAVQTEDPQVPIHGKADIEKLCKHLDNARQVAASQRLVEGGIANFFVARMRFPDQNLNKDFASHMSFATPITLPAALGGRFLRFHFALWCGVLYVAARDDKLEANSIAPFYPMQKKLFPRCSDMTMCLVSVDSSLLMHYRELSISINGPWEPALTGMLTLKQGRPAAAEALTRGVLCVFCIRNTERIKSSRFAQYLNLDIAV